MMYPYITFEDGTEVVHSQIVSDHGADKVYVHFERPTQNGFDSARCGLPTYTWTNWEGHFSSAEKAAFEDFLAANAHLIFRFAADGGAKVA